MAANMKEYGLELLKGNKYNENDPQMDSNPFWAQAKYFRLIADRLKEDGVATFQILEAMNPNSPFNLFNSEQRRDKFVIVDMENLNQTGQRGTKKKNVAGVEYDVPDFEKLFGSQRFGLASPGSIGHFFALSEDSTKRRESKFAIENDDVFFSRGDFETGYIEVDGDDAAAEMGDESQYVPFFFEDLRKPGRRIYFRAFLTTFSENITPEYSTEKIFGRVDPVPIYKSTTRTFTVAFKIAAMSPAGFSTMWKKVNNLSKMMYPTYREGVMVRGPILRVRIGDVMCDGSGNGLPGFTSGLGFDYSESPWEINKFKPSTTEIELGKAPMIINASFTFTVIHEENPQLDEEYNFNYQTFRRIGSLEDTSSVQKNVPETNSEAEGETTSDDSAGLSNQEI